MTPPDAERIVNATEFRFSSLKDLLGPTGPFGEIWQMVGRSGLQAMTPEADRSGHVPD